MNEILNSLQKVNEELTAIEKNQKGYGYNFRGIDQVLNTLSPLFKKHKILVSRRNLIAERSTRELDGKNGKRAYVETFIKSCDYVFTSTLDGSEFVSQGFGEGQDTSGGDKSASMATSNSYKYVIFEMFSIATEEQKDSDQSTAIEEEKKEKERQRIENMNSIIKQIIVEFNRLLSQGMDKEYILKKFGASKGKNEGELKEMLDKMKKEKKKGEYDEMLKAIDLIDVTKGY